MDEVLISVVIPFYNVDRYLGKCLDSLLGITGKESIQIILIDDGSTDKSVDIAEEYCKRHSNIQTIHAEHQGPSVARNLGIREARGKYIFFCDADDEVVSEEFSRFLNKFDYDGADIILWDGIPFSYDNRTITQKSSLYFEHRGLAKNSATISGQRALEKQLDSCNSFPGTVWLGLYRKQFILDNELYFAEGILHEDELWVVMSYIYAQSVIYTGEKLYKYRLRRGSITNPDVVDWTNHIESLLYVYSQLFIETKKISDGSFRRKLNATLTRRYLHMIFYYDFYKYGYGDKIDKELLWIYSGRLVDKIRVIILYLKSFMMRLKPGTGSSIK